MLSSPASEGTTAVHHERPALALPRPWRLRHTTPLFFALLLACHWSALDEPPAWDAAMSVFPAAITLAAHHLDYGHLLAQPGYEEGGPNVHALSLVTLVTTLAYRLLGPQPAVVLPILHLLHFAAAALAFAFLCRLAQRLVGSAAGLAVTAVVLLHPLVQAQSRAIYLEVPLLLGAAAAVDAWVRRRPGESLAWAALATLVKPTGAVVGAGLAIATLAAGEQPLRRRLLLAAAYVPGAILPIVLQLVLDPARVSFQQALSISMLYAAQAPDLVLLPAAYLLGVALRRPWSATAGAMGADARRVHLAFAGLVAAFFLFFRFLALVGSAVPILPRYLLLIVPFAVLGLAALLRPYLPPRVAAVVLLAVGVCFVVNRRGALYPEADNNFATLERSLEYEDMLALQLLDQRQLERLPLDLPVFYGKSEHYRLRYPAMGYAQHPLPNGHALDHERPWSAGRLEDFPPAFAVLVEHDWLGGEVGLDVARQAGADPRRRLERRELCVRARCSLLFEIHPAP